METSGCILGSERHGQICGGLVTVSCHSIFSCSTWSCSSCIGPPVRVRALGPRRGWASGAGRAGQARALAGPGKRAAPALAPSAFQFLFYSISRLETFLGHLRAVPNGTGLYCLVSAAVIRPKTTLQGLWLGRGHCPVCPLINLSRPSSLLGEGEGGVWVTGGEGWSLHEFLRGHLRSPSRLKTMLLGYQG